MVRPELSNPLGSYPDRDEFQVGTTLVWIEIPGHGKRTDWLSRGARLFEDLWTDCSRVAEFAQQRSRTVIPDFRAAHDEAGTSDEQLAVWGIWISPEDRSAVYEVNRNHAFRSGIPESPEFPEDESVMVHRDAQGVLRLQSPSA